MTRRTFLAALALLGLMATAFARADPPAEAIQAEVISVKGAVSMRQADDAKAAWAQVNVGDKLGQYVMIRTGLGSEVVLKFADRGELLVRSSTKIGISELHKKQDHVKATVGLKYGSVRLDVHERRGSRDFRVATAQAVLSVRNTGDNVGHSEMGTGASGTDGKALVEFLNGLKSEIKTGERANESGDLSVEIIDRILYFLKTGKNLSDEEWDLLRKHGWNRGPFDFNTGNTPGPGCTQFHHTPTGDSTNSGGEHYEYR
jgi:hypothetical protein